MDGAKTNLLQGALEQLLEESNDIEAVAVVSIDGFPLASVIPEGYESERLGAMSAALLSLGERTASELNRGELAQVFVEGAQGYVFVLAAGDDTVLTAVVHRGGKLGAVLYEIRKTAKKIAEIVGSHLQAEVE